MLAAHEIIPVRIEPHLARRLAAERVDGGEKKLFALVGYRSSAVTQDDAIHGVIYGRQSSEWTSGRDGPRRGHHFSMRRRCAIRLMSYGARGLRVLRRKAPVHFVVRPSGALPAASSSVPSSAILSFSPRRSLSPDC